MTRTMTKTHTKINTKTKTKTNTKCFKDPSHAIFFKSREFKDIKYDTNSDHKDKDKDKDKGKEKDKDKDKAKDKDKDKDKLTKRANKCYLFENDMTHGYQI